MMKRILAILLPALFCISSSASAQWYVGVDFMLPTRNAGADTVFQRNQTGLPVRVGNQPVLSEKDLELDFAPAGRITFGNRSGIFGIDGSYMFTDEWSETASVFDVGGQLASPFTNIGTAPNPVFDNNTSAVISYDTELSSADFNLTQRIYSGWNGDATLLYGARYLTIDEAFLYTSSNAGFDHSILTTTENRMIGPQLGALLETPFRGGMFSFAFKVSMAYNSVDKTTLFDGTFGQGGDSSASMISEVGVNCMFFPVRNVSIRIGYHLLAATDVALATSNFERNLAVLGSGFANVQTDRGVAYHSPYIGAVFAY